jgi:serine/threonine protein kinase
MNVLSTLTLVSNRYRIVDQIGSGSMGVVHRAVDRLSGDAVALKWVTVPGNGLQFASLATISDFRLALAQEFKTLASLRHPHIISVLDYGFVRDPSQGDGRPHPFFTMTLLDGARTILEAGQGQSQGTKIDLLIQVLQALAYLHRCGILHRDLKPANVLVTAGPLEEVWGQVKVLDFSLSAALDMAAIVARARKRLQRLVEETQAEILQPATWPAALGYGPWIEEVWVNYIGNSLKYGGHSPKLELGADPQPEGTIRFWVRDRGPGIPPQDQERLFTEFTRLRRDRGEGHGLGLSIVRRIVEKLGGGVGVQSSGIPGQGSTFYFTLPQQGQART